MRTLSEIIKSVKNGERPDYEEVRYALLVYEFMFTMDHKTLFEALMKDEPYPKFIRKLKAENSHTMVQNAMSKSPAEYLSWSSNPDNPEYQKRRAVSIKIAEKFLGDKHD